jgi:hypothetical protein
MRFPWAGVYREGFSPRFVTVGSHLAKEAVTSPGVLVATGVSRIDA